MIHSKESNPRESFSFAKNLKIQNILSQWYQYPQHILSTFEKQLIANGFKIVIYF